MRRTLASEVTERTESSPSAAIEDPVLYPPRVVAGIQPTLRVHLGHYFGAIKQQVNLHHQYPGQTFYFIADYHALTRSPEPERVQRGTLELATTYLALGLDPNKAILYRQSDVPEVTELAWILSCMTTVSELERIPTYQTKSQGGAPVLGLLAYPVLMAADILALRGTRIPVGKDQEPNVRKTRELARKFNRDFNVQLFPVPAFELTEAHTLRGVDGQKMSEQYDNTIGLFESFDLLERRVMSIRTDSKQRYEPKSPDECTVFELYSMVAPATETAELRRRYELGQIGYEDAKRELMHHIQHCFAPYQERYRDLKADPDLVLDVLREGFVHAKAEAEDTLEEIRALVGLQS